MTPDDTLALRWASDPRVSPDGTRVAYVVHHIDPEANAYRSTIWIGSTDGATPDQPATPATDRHLSPRWSPDGTRLAYVRITEIDDVAPEDKILAQLQVAAADAAPAEEATVLVESREAIDDPVFSPDGRWLAYANRVRGPHYDEDDTARRPPRRIMHRYYRLNGEGVIIDRPTHVHVVAADGSTPPLDVTPGDTPVSQPAWFPDSDRLVAVAERPATSWLTSDVVVLDRRGGRLDALTAATGHYEQPRVSADGTTVALIGYDDVGIHPQNNAVGVIAAAGAGQSVEWISRDLDRTWDGFAHTQPGAALVGLVQDRGNVHAYRAEPTGAPVLLTAGERTLTGWSTAAGVTAFAASTPARPAEIFIADAAGERRHTSVADDFVGAAGPVPAERFTARSAGEEVDAWIFTPPNFDPGRRYPLLFNIHGGPFTQYGNVFFDEAQHQARAGFVVVLSNPRGSSGRHTAWGQATMGRKHRNPGTGWGAIDYDDLMAVVDTAIERYPFIDPDRLGVIGGSYGGYMTSWIISHDHRFAAACSERAVNNLVSLDQSSDSAGLWHSWFGPSQRDDMAEYLAMSPITYADAIETPLLIIHSDNDLRCPFEQADQLFYALLDDGKEVEYHLFPDEDHELSRSGSPIHRVQRAELILDYFTRHLTP